MKGSQVKEVLNLNWYVITGGPSSGKTSAIKELSRLGYITFSEAARVFIDKEMAKGKSLEEIRGNEAKFQEEVFRLKVEVEKKAPEDKIVFFDRGLPDSIAYYQVCGLDPQKIIRLCQKKRYRKIFFLEQLPFEKDYARIEDDKTVKKLNKLLRESYTNLGYVIVDIPAMSIEKGVQKILSEIESRRLKNMKLIQTYAKAGVDRKIREKTKKSLKDFGLTYRLSKYGKIIKTPFNILYPIGNEKYQVKTCDGVGTKVLLAESANKHDTIGQDAIAMVVNDCIRCGAKPIAITDVIDIKKSEPKLLKEIQKGLVLGAKEAGCPLVGGETADVPELLNTTYHINCDCVGEIRKKKIITGKNITPGNIVIGLQSSGVHSNGLTLVRKILFKKWGGKFNAFEIPNGFDRELIYEVLKPTRIYVKSFLKIAKQFNILGVVHITGDAYLKFKKLSKKSIGFEFNNFKPQPIFNLIQKIGKINSKEMFKTFNMGWGFAIIIKKKDINKILELLKKQKVKADVIGKVIKERKIIINYKNRKIIL